MPVAARSTAFVHLSPHAKLDRLLEVCPKRHAALVALMDAAWTTEQRVRRQRQARASLREPAAKRRTGT